MFTHTRHDFLKMIAASIMALSPAGKFATTAFAQPKEPRPEGNITVRVTAADQRYALVDPLRWRRVSGKAGTNTIVILGSVLRRAAARCRQQTATDPWLWRGVNGCRLLYDQPDARNGSR